MEDLYLIHHGKKGQKWGIRNAEWYPISEWKAHLKRDKKPNLKKFQTEDGRLTNKGKKRLDSYYKKHYEDHSIYDKSVELDKKKAGLNKNVLKEGSEIHRIANSEEKIDSKRKYASITDSDLGQYEEYASALGLDPNKDISTFTYTAIKDLKIADGKKVVDDVLNKYGDVRIKNIHNTLETYKNIDIPYLDENKIKKISEKEYIHIIEKEYDSFIEDVMKTKMNDIIKDYKKKGYDAIVDIEDMKFADFPIILLNPKESIKLKKEYKWN